MTTYKIVRFYQDPNRRANVIARGVTLEQARAHCNDPETNSRTATKAPAREVTRRNGGWFDGYEAE